MTDIVYHLLVHEERREEAENGAYAHILESICPKCSADWGHPCNFVAPKFDQSTLSYLLDEARIAKEIYQARFGNYDNNDDLQNMEHWEFVISLLNEKLGNRDVHAY